MALSRRTPSFAAAAMIYAELYDGISPMVQRVSLRVAGQGSTAMLELKNVETQGSQRWSLADMRQVPDQASADAFIFAPDNAGPARLVIREREALRILLSALPDLKPLRPRNGSPLRLLGLAGAAVVAFGAILFALIPFMADKGAEMIPPATEMALGQTTFNQIYPAMGAYECTDPAGQAALAVMQTRLTDGLDLPYPVQVHVVFDPSLNATALPGGYVTLHNGLIQAAETPEEVAAVLAHEIGHVAHRDGTRAVLRRTGSFGIIGLAYGDFLGSSAVAAVTQQLVNSSYSREAEARADAYAHDLLAHAGVSPASLAVFFERLRAEGLDTDLGVFRHLSSHPGLLDRIAASTAAADHGFTQGPPILSGAEWGALQSICQNSAHTAIDKS
ncbi:M48 family metallopeptidase [Rhodophyticola sp. CCM32]|uniref:M48 family metallopeptidase n=1 Tax=Rhodophyticola sp. CCM32 TaxID=2916397 RepID=UPI00107FCEC4|nr:M48 family metallopeptidase [Rhodophyticola sp. CCM32]QBY02318.1 M48 family metallopeptidase [Rhodophyticola sp. CCM32]